jgi:hypothetical protein
MIARSFKSVLWVATVGAAALGCYMVSLKVATERNELTKVERQIIAAKRDIRALQTELGTRGRLSQLELWNAEVLALSAPTSAQFLQSEVTLARFEQTVPSMDERTAQVRMASAEVQQPAPQAAAPSLPVVVAVAPAVQAPQPLVRQASFTTVEAKAVEKPKPVAAKPIESQKSKVAAVPAKAETKTAAKTDPKPPAAKQQQAKAQPKPEAKAPSAKQQEAKAGKTRGIDPKLAAEIAAQSDGGN